MLVRFKHEPPHTLVCRIRGGLLVNTRTLDDVRQRASNLNLTVNQSNEMYEIRNTRVTLMCLKTLDEVSIFIHGYEQGASK